MTRPPQPDLSRLVPFVGHPGVVGVTPGLSDLVPLTAVSWAQATGATLYFAYADPMRYAVAEHPDGTVEHVDVDPDVANDWRRRAADLETHLHELVDPSGVPWHFRYLAGRPDRALTHLARAVDAAVIVVGTGSPGLRGGLRRLVDINIGGARSLSTHLTHHQHRPVLVVPLRVVDWKDEIE